MKSRVGRGAIVGQLGGSAGPYTIVGSRAPSSDGDGIPAGWQNLSSGSQLESVCSSSGPRAAVPVAQASKAGSSLTTSMLNLSKNIIGAGMLSLPFAMKCAGVVPFCVGMAFIGIVNAYTFFLLGWCCRETGSNSFGELWATVFGRQSAWVADLSVLLNNGLACLAYCVLIGDFCSKAFTGLLPTVELLHSRGANLVIVASLALVPLSLLRDLAPLRFSSIAGLGATLYGFSILFSDCAATINLGDASSPIRTNFFPVRVDFFQAIALFSSAFMAHYNSPKFFADLEDNTLARFGLLVCSAFGLALTTFAIFGFAGFALFGFSVNGNVLTNYDASTRALLSWLGMAFSVIFTFPLVFGTFRDSCFSLLSHLGAVKDPTSPGFRTTFTVLAVILGVFGGTVFSNVAVVNGVKGAVMSACLAFIYPAMIHLRLSQDQLKDQSKSLMRGVSMALIFLGAGLGVLALLAMFWLPKTNFAPLAAKTSMLGH